MYFIESSGVLTSVGRVGLNRQIFLIPLPTNRFMVFSKNPSVSLVSFLWSKANFVIFNSFLSESMVKNPCLMGTIETSCSPYLPILWNITVPYLRIMVNGREGCSTVTIFESRMIRSKSCSVSYKSSN